MAGQLPCEGAGLGAAESQQAVVGRQRAPVEQHHLVVVVVRAEGAGRSQSVTGGGGGRNSSVKVETQHHSRSNRVLLFPLEYT